MAAFRIGVDEFCLNKFSQKYRKLFEQVLFTYGIGMTVPYFEILPKYLFKTEDITWRSTSEIGVDMFKNEIL